MPPVRFRPWLLAALAIAALAAIALATLPGVLAGALRRAAVTRGYHASFGRLGLTAGPGVRVHELTVIRAVTGDTVLVADTLVVRLALLPLLRLRVSPAAIRLADARVHSQSRRAADPDTLAPDEPRSARRARRGRVDHPERVRGLAMQAVRALLVPARTLPRLDLRDVRFVRIGADGDTLVLRLERLALAPERGGVRLEARGALEMEQRVPFEGSLAYGRDDRLTGAWTFGVPDPRRGERWPLTLGVDVRLHQDRRAGRVELREPSTLRIGAVPLRLTATVERDGPAVRFALAADSLDDQRVRASLPPPVLGPLAGVVTRGQWDYRLGFSIDLARPDSVDFTADVIPRGLALDPARTRLALFGLDQPFTAAIHLPRDRVVPRDLSSANPHFRPLDAIDSVLAHAVVTNEDGAFFRHRGFNTEAVRGAIADNVRAGAYRRGAGTITMQLVRNLYLGHARTLSRKAQEVALAWVIEHLTGVSKRRLLEIYLNVIEWGPGIHGADEATHYYFGHDAGKLTVDEALFLTTVIPAPTKWRWRFDGAGELREFERAQMHFIGRAMVAKGWLDPAKLPAAEDLRVALRGPAREVLFPPATPVSPEAGVELPGRSAPPAAAPARL